MRGICIVVVGMLALSGSLSAQVATPAPGGQPTPPSIPGGTDTLEDGETKTYNVDGQTITVRNTGQNTGKQVKVRWFGTSGDITGIKVTFKNGSQGRVENATENTRIETKGNNQVTVISDDVGQDSPGFDTKDGILISGDGSTVNIGTQNPNQPSNNNEIEVGGSNNTVNVVGDNNQIKLGGSGNTVNTTGDGNTITN